MSLPIEGMGYLSLPVPTQWEETVVWSHIIIRKGKSTIPQMPGKKGEMDGVKQSNDSHSAAMLGFL